LSPYIFILLIVKLFYFFFICQAGEQVLRGIWVMLFFMGFRFCVAKVVQKKGKNKGKNKKNALFATCTFCTFFVVRGG